MKRIVVISTVLFALHSAEEALTKFWETDPSFLLTKTFGLKPEVAYWLAQSLLYIFLFLTYRYLHTPREKATLFVLGVILAFEFWHPLATLQAGTYVSGLVTGMLISVFSVWYWVKLYNYLKDKH